MAPIFDKFFKGKAAAAAPAPAQDQYQALFDQAVSAASARNFQRAIQLFDQALGAAPGQAEAYYKRGNAQKDSGQLDAAIASYDEAIARKPDYAYAYCNRGYIEQRQGRLQSALFSYDAALTADPTDAMTHYNRALLLQDLSRWPEALADYDRAIAINPDYADAQYNRALSLLYTGDFEGGWPAFEWRWKNAQRLGIGEDRQFKQPRWLGRQSIAGRRLLLHSEQGLGDTIQFCRYASACAQQGATVILEVQPPLVDLLQSLAGVSEVLPKGAALPAFDYHCPLMSLPLAFGTTLATIPSPGKYLHSDPAKVAEWRALLGERTRPRIGLTWSGNRNAPIEYRRRIPLAELVRQLPPQFQYFQLQTQVRDSDEPALDATDFLFSVDLQDFSDTAAVCDCMDLVISVDTSLLHLSGALGQRTWGLMPFIPDWRWLQQRLDVPWYSSIRLYRQQTAADWSEVLTRVAADLQREFP